MGLGSPHRRVREDDVVFFRRDSTLRPPFPSLQHPISPYLQGVAHAIQQKRQCKKCFR
jgi:hypothetical protein